MGYLLWDFDGTIGYRTGGWSEACVAVLRETEAAPDAEVSDIRPHLQDGFPWHTPEDPHTHLSTAEEWWAELYPVLARPLEANGVSPAEARHLAERVRRTYVERGWDLFEDARPALSALADDGWRHVILSNHVPELGRILADLDVREYFEAVYTSAETGYEKPHPRAFRTVLSDIEDGATVWMIGDSVRADVEGARDVGLPAILVRDTHTDVEYACLELRNVADVVSGR